VARSSVSADTRRRWQPTTSTPWRHEFDSRDEGA
jgi:hypothetical protein